MESSSMDLLTSYIRSRIITHAGTTKGNQLAFLTSIEQTVEASQF